MLFTCFFFWYLLLTQVIWFVKASLDEVLWQRGWLDQLTYGPPKNICVTNFWLQAFIFGSRSWIGIILSYLDFPLITLQPPTATASNDVTRSFWRCQMKLISTFHGSIWLGFADSEPQVAATVRRGLRSIFLKEPPRHRTWCGSW